ncbi:MAG: hypothetical protein K2W96_18170 [Gemmataceae bacterium]|nr:hypothetical protein [Gemmataceae bacterium]
MDALGTAPKTGWRLKAGVGDIAFIRVRSESERPFSKLKVEIEGDKDSALLIGVVTTEVPMFRSGGFVDPTKLDHLAHFKGVKEGTVLVKLTPINKDDKELPALRVSLVVIDWRKEPQQPRLRSMELYEPPPKTPLDLGFFIADIAVVKVQSNAGLPFSRLDVEIEGDKDSVEFLGVVTAEVKKEGTDLIDPKALDHLVYFKGRKAGKALLKFTLFVGEDKDLRVRKAALTVHDRKAPDRK